MEPLSLLVILFLAFLSICYLLCMLNLVIFFRRLANLLVLISEMVVCLLDKYW